VGAIVVIKGKRPIGRGFQVISTNANAWITLVVDRREVPFLVTQNPYSARARAVENEVVGFIAVAVIECEDSVAGGFQVISTNAIAWITLAIDRREIAVIVMQNPYGARSRAIQTKVVLFAAVIVVERKGPISFGFEVITPNAIAWIALVIDGRKIALIVAQDPYGARSRTIENEVVLFTAVVIIESEGEICGGFQIVSTNAIAWITLAVDRREIAVIVTQNP